MLLLCFVQTPICFCLAIRAPNVQLDLLIQVGNKFTPDQLADCSKLQPTRKIRGCRGYSTLSWNGGHSGGIVGGDHL